jgi:hypothetical protein
MASSVHSSVDFERPGKYFGKLWIPRSTTNDSAWGNLCVPVISIASGHGPTVLVLGGNDIAHTLPTGPATRFLFHHCNTTHTSKPSVMGVGENARSGNLADPPITGRGGPGDALGVERGVRIGDVELSVIQTISRGGNAQKLPGARTCRRRGIPSGAALKTALGEKGGAKTGPSPVDRGRLSYNTT